MDRVADRCSDNLGLKSVVVEDLHDVLDQIDTCRADVVESAKERRYIGCACARCKKRLVCCENKRHIRLDSLCGQHFDCL